MPTSRCHSGEKLMRLPRLGWYRVPKYRGIAKKREYAEVAERAEGRRGERQARRPIADCAPRLRIVDCRLRNDERGPRLFSPNASTFAAEAWVFSPEALCIPE